jgi:hypothetical protein
VLCFICPGEPEHFHNNLKSLLKAEFRIFLELPLQL